MSKVYRSTVGTVGSTYGTAVPLESEHLELSSIRSEGAELNSRDLIVVASLAEQSAG